MTFRVGEKLNTKGCAKGWHEIAPGNLFICTGKGVIVSDEEVTFAPSPPPPNLESPLPYEYAFITADNTPQYWRVPTEQESSDVQALFERIATRNQKNPTEIALASALAKAEELAARTDGGAAEDGPSTATESEKEVATLAPDGGVVDPYALPAFLYMRMNRGYYVSTSSSASEKRGFQSTIRGRLIPADKLAPAKPTSFEGLLLDGAMTLPRVFVVGGGVKLLRQENKGGPFKSVEKVARLSDFPFIGESKRRKRRYVQVGDDLFLSSRVAAVVRMAEPPEDLKPNERWIDIDLSEQTLVAYEGERPVFATLVSTGRKGFETPTGAFRIYSKHVTITMDDTEAGEEAYSIEDIPWTQYFEEGYALHTAFWHTRFGRVRSHGCINLAPADAHRLFFWTGPHLPDGIHGIVATRENRGTRIVIHE
ncbi:MAG: L,D-transpeptidase [Deltaproteobacteria bacterium]|nr:L,D-transpeptidase [Deltaproteobacteria bacterium]